ILGAHWDVMEERAAQFGTTVDRDAWRLVGAMHIADTEEQARDDVRFGLPQWIDYFSRVAALPLPAPEEADIDAQIKAITEIGFAVIGTPEMAVAQIQRLRDQSGGFGSFLFMAHDWADREATLHSCELVAREVMPAFQGSAVSTTTARDFAAERRPALMGQVGEAVGKAITDHQAEREADRKSVV